MNNDEIKLVIKPIPYIDNTNLLSDLHKLKDRLFMSSAYSPSHNYITYVKRGITEGIFYSPFNDNLIKIEKDGLFNLNHLLTKKDEFQLIADLKQTHSTFFSGILTFDDHDIKYLNSINESINILNIILKPIFCLLGSKEDHYEVFAGRHLNGSFSHLHFVFFNKEDNTNLKSISDSIINIALSYLKNYFSSYLFRIKQIKKSNAIFLSPYQDKIEKKFIKYLYNLSFNNDDEKYINQIISLIIFATPSLKEKYQRYQINNSLDEVYLIASFTFKKEFFKIMNIKYLSPETSSFQNNRSIQNSIKKKKKVLIKNIPIIVQNIINELNNFFDSDSKDISFDNQREVSFQSSDDFYR